VAGASYKPALLEDHARLLYCRASSIQNTAIVLGLALGGLVGATPLTSLVTAWHIPAAFGVATAIGGTAAGALLGYVVGQGRAQRLRTDAQKTLCALSTERSVNSILAWLDAARTQPDEPSLNRSPEPPRVSFAPDLSVVDELAGLGILQTREP
jgi:hypothetical protein